jgi:hypothetical protein
MIFYDDDDKYGGMMRLVDHESERITSNLCSKRVLYLIICIHANGIVLYNIKFEGMFP